MIHTLILIPNDVTCSICFRDERISSVRWPFCLFPFIRKLSNPPLFMIFLLSSSFNSISHCPIMKMKFIPPVPSCRRDSSPVPSSRDSSLHTPETSIDPSYKVRLVHGLLGLYPFVAHTEVTSHPPSVHLQFLPVHDLGLDRHTRSFSCV